MKRAIETRKETGDYVRAFSISQFNKYHSMPEVSTFCFIIYIILLSSYEKWTADNGKYLFVFYMESLCSLT